MNRRPTFPARLRRARDRAQGRVSAFSRSGGAGEAGRYARGLASEGFDAGYVAALDDVDLERRGVPACRRPEYWRED